MKPKLVVGRFVMVEPDVWDRVAELDKPWHERMSTIYTGLLDGIQWERSSEPEGTDLEMPLGAIRLSCGGFRMTFSTLAEAAMAAEAYDA